MRDTGKMVGAEGFSTPLCENQLRPGGVFRNCMLSPDGKEYCGTGRYREIQPYKRLVFTDSFSDKQGRVVPATEYGMSPEFPLEMLVELDFSQAGGKTKLSLRHIGIPEGKDQDDCRAGWSQSFDKLAQLLKH